MSLHRTRQGEGTPMVLVHGLGSNLRVWDPMLPRLARAHDVLAVDLPGFGESAPGDEATTVAHAAAVAAAMDEEGVARAHLVGNSLGGRLVLELALMGRARSVVGISPAGMASAWEWAITRRALLTAQPVARAALPALEALTGSGVGRRVTGLLPMRRHVDHDWSSYTLRSFATSPGYRPTLSIQPRLLEGLEAIDVPVLLLWGTRDRVLLPRQARRFAAAIPGVQVRMLRGLGHVPMLHDPDLVSDLVLGFAARVDAQPSPKLTTGE